MIAPPCARRLAPLVLATALAFPAPALASSTGEDLNQAYPATLSWSGSGLTTVCGPEDVWQLRSFELAFAKDFSIECGPAAVAFGVHDTNVLWAAVFPEQPPEIDTVQAGRGEHAKTIFLRFPPGEIGKLFPSKTVRKGGPSWLRAEAWRIARRKTVWKWCTPAGNPTVVQPGWCLVDIDTVEGPRRFYGIDRNGNTLEYVPDFEDAPVPASPPIESAAALAAFDEVHAAFDREYAGFGRLPKLDWAELGASQRQLAGEADTVFELAAILGDMLARLEDLHVWVKAGEEFVPGYARERPLNASWNATQSLANARQKSGSDLMWGRTDDGIGYLGISGLSDPKLPEHVDRALEALGDTWGLIVDLRFNGGGDELLGREIAGRFADEERVYSLHQFRSGAGHAELGPKLERRFAPRGPWRYEAPVVCLIGQRTMSSAESTALMFAQCPQVTLMGDRSAGSSGNPRRLELDCGVTVNLPRWLDMDPAGKPIEGVGISPDEPVKALPADFTEERDPVLEAALERLGRLSASKRAPGRR